MTVYENRASYWVIFWITVLCNMITSFCCFETENLSAWLLNPCPNNFYMKIYFICFGHCLGRQVATPTRVSERILVFCLHQSNPNGPKIFYSKYEYFKISILYYAGRQVATPTWVWEEIGHHSWTVRGADHRTPQCHSRAKEKDREAPN